VAPNESYFTLLSGCRSALSCSLSRQSLGRSCRPPLWGRSRGCMNLSPGRVFFSISCRSHQPQRRTDLRDLEAGQAPTRAACRSNLSHQLTDRCRKSPGIPNRLDRFLCHESHKGLFPIPLFPRGPSDRHQITMSPQTARSSRMNGVLSRKQLEPTEHCHPRSRSRTVVNGFRKCGKSRPAHGSGQEGHRFRPGIGAMGLGRIEVPFPRRYRPRNHCRGLPPT
jgi:hypothetical protein